MSHRYQKPAAPTVDVLQHKLERRVSIYPPSDHDDIEPAVRLANSMETLGIAWRQVPSPVKLLVWAGVLALAAPALHRAADSLSLEPSELLELLQLT